MSTTKTTPLALRCPRCGGAAEEVAVPAQKGARKAKCQSAGCGFESVPYTPRTSPFRPRRQVRRRRSQLGVRTGSRWYLDPDERAGHDERREG